MKTLTLSILTLITLGAKAQVIVSNTSELHYTKVNLSAPVINPDSAMAAKFRKHYAKGCVNLMPHSTDPRACDSLAKYNDLYEPYAADKGNVVYTRAVCKYKNLNTQVMEGMMDAGYNNTAEYFASMKKEQKESLLKACRDTKSSLEVYMASYSILNDYSTENSRKWMKECDGYIAQLTK